MNRKFRLHLKFNFVIWCAAIFFVAPLAPALAQNAPGGRNLPFRSTRVEELFIWKISEELKLSVKEEKDVSALIKDLNQRKADANEKIESLVQKHEQKQETPDSDTGRTGNAAASGFLKDYKSALADYNKISIDEIERIQKILPKIKAAKYFVVKTDLSKRIRSLLVMPERVHDRTLEKSKLEQAPMEDPKIIEE